jgi:protein-tyrosine phosphatase
MANSDIGVLFVCLGNICRSPTAEGVFRKRVADAGMSDIIRVDSAGTHAYHTGEPPDRRAILAAQKRGVDLSDIRARRITATDFETFQFVLAMDESNLRNLRELCPAEYSDRLRLFLEFSGEVGVREVPDPYYGGALGFERVLDLVEEAADGLLTSLSTRIESNRG